MNDQTEKINNLIKETISYKTGTPSKHITDHKRIIYDLGCTHLDFTDIIIMCESKLEVDVSVSILDEVETVGEFIQFFEDELIKA